MSVRSVFRQLGAFDGTLYLVGQVLGRMTGQRIRIVKYRLVAQPIGRPGTPALRPDAATVIESVPQGSAQAAVFPRPATVLNRRYAAGATCTAARVRGEFAGFIWLQRKQYEEDEVRCTYVLARPDVSVWDFDVYVEPRYRVGRTMARLWGQVDADLAATGVRWSFSRISAFNAASLASHARLGTVACGSAVFLVLGPWQLACWTSAPFVHFSASKASGPLLRLNPPA